MHSSPSEVVSGRTEVHPKQPAVVKSPSVNDPYDNTSRIAFEDYVYHPVYTEEEVRAVKVVHHEVKDTPGKVADIIVRACRWGTDIVTRYVHVPPEKIAAIEKAEGRQLTVQELRDRRLIMTPDQWLLRTLFLESIAGVPGMVGAVLRHLRSLRLLKRDGGWLRTLLSEAENERMHLLCFMTIKQPGWLFRMLVLVAQGVFTNALFALYLISPRSVHRFVQRLEVEAVYTYSMLIEEIESGRLPEWHDKPAPQIAVDYWRLPEGKRTMLDMIYAIRADEAGHRFVNGTLANLAADDVNPYGALEPPAEVRGARAEMSREEALEWLRSTTEAARKRHEEQKTGRAE